MNHEPRSGAPRDSRYAAGFTAIGIIVLAALAYSIRITLEPGAARVLLTVMFLVANVVGWALGSLLRSREPRSILGLFLVLLGDAIFPLNLYAPFVLSMPGTRGSAALSATAVLLIGIVYHLWNYRRRSSVRFALPFYPYFFALAGGAALVLTRFTLGLPMWVAALLVLLYAAAFDEFARRRRPEPALHFSIAGAAILLASVAVSAFAFRDRNAIALAEIVAGAALLIASTIRERGDEGAARGHGLAAWLGITLTMTAFLYYAHSAPWIYIVATGTWTLVLAIVSTRQGRGWSEPFPESAWWAAMLLAAGLAVAVWQVWMPFLVKTMAARPPAGATVAALAEAGAALLLVSVWRRRYPPIAATMRGFVTNNVLLRLTSYAAPLFLIVALTGGWAMAGAPQPANVYALLAAGTLLLIAGPLLARHYPAEALDFAGVLAMVFSAFNALESAPLSAAVLFAAAVIFLARYVRGAKAWTFAAFLILTVTGLVLQAIGTPAATAVFAAAAAAMGWAGARAEQRGNTVLSRITYWLAHGAGFVFWLSLARTLGLGRGYDAVILATWAWVAFAAFRMARDRAARTSLHACLALMVASAAFLLFRPVETRVMLVSLLVLAALLLELRHVRLLGFALLAVAVIVAANRADAQWLLAVLLAAAAVLLWRSLVNASSLGQLLFIAAAAAAAYLAMPARGPLQAMPFAALVALLLVVELIALKVRPGSPFHADFTSVVAALLAVTVVVAEITSARFSVWVLAVLLLAVAAVRPWIAASEVHRVQPAAHAAFRVIGIVAAAVAVVAAGRMAGWTPGQQVFALACSMWAALAWLLLTPRRTPAGIAAAVAVHIIGIGVYVSALVVRAGDPFLLAACVAAAGAYFVWRTAWNAMELEHFAAAGLVVAVCLWGLANRVPWIEYYLLAVAAYLCLVLLRRTAPRAENYVAVAAILAAVAYPYVALLRTAGREHLLFLGFASVVVIHVLLATRRPALMVVSVCAMLGLGMLFGAAALQDDVRLNLLMAVVGFLVIADLGVLGLRSDRRAMVGEIDYDDYRVTR